MIEFTQGNLLEANAEALVNTVNTDGVMGKGIALQFKRAFPSTFLVYEREARAGRLATGKVLIDEVRGLHGPRFIIHFPTKRHWRNPSKLSYIDEGLVSLIAEVRRLGIRSIAVPPLGCGNGGLAWSDVLPRIQAAFAEVPEVKVLLFAPAGAPPANEMPTRTSRPKMTAGRAAMVAAMGRYRGTGFDYPLTLLEVQKLAYFMQSAGQPLKLEFTQGSYGPYADELRNVLNRMEGHFVQGWGAGDNKPEQPIQVLADAVAEAELFLATDAEVQKRFKAVADLIEDFETPFGMELLSTVHWVAAHGEDARRDAAAAAAAVQKWNTRKAGLMKPYHVEAAWRRLHDQHWL